MSKWKPGDLVIATVGGRENVRLVAGWSKYDPQLRWCELSPRWAEGDDDECWFMPSQVTDHRRLVGIELPPGAKAGWPTLVDALARAREKTSLHMVFGGLIEQINEQTVRIPEPTDVAARVTDNRDNIWRLLADGEWVCTSGPDIGEYLTWDRLAAERGPLEVES